MTLEEEKILQECARKTLGEPFCPHCGQALKWDPEEDEADEENFADFILHWLADVYGCPCDYDFAGICASDYMYERDNDYCEENCNTHNDYDCWKKFLELKYQEHKREGAEE